MRGTPMLIPSSPIDGHVHTDHKLLIGLNHPPITYGQQARPDRSPPISLSCETGRLCSFIPIMPPRPDNTAGTGATGYRTFKTGRLRGLQPCKVPEHRTDRLSDV